MSQKRQIIIDEAFPNNRVDMVSKLLKSKGINHSSFYFISQKHPGMPDYQIIHFLLNESTVFITTDRPLHNTVLKKGFKSFFFNGDNFSSKTIKGVTPIKLPPLIKKGLQPKTLYEEPKTEIRHLVLPSSEKSLKKLRKKRRRIRNYFGGTENMEMVAITISFNSFKSYALIGVRIKISSSTGAKALDASEKYFREKLDLEYSEIIALCYAMIVPIQLMLNHVKTILYFDTRTFEEPSKYQSYETEGQYHYMYSKLIDSFSQIEFTPSAKGLFIERLRRKLSDLSMSNSNEIVKGNISEISSKIQQAGIAKAC